MKPLDRASSSVRFMRYLERHYTPPAALPLRWGRLARDVAGYNYRAGEVVTIDGAYAICEAGERVTPPLGVLYFGSVYNCPHK